MPSTLFNSDIQNLGLVGQFTGTYKRGSMPEMTSIDNLLKKVRTHRQANIFAEPKIKYEKSPFREGVSPVLVTGL